MEHFNTIDDRLEETVQGGSGYNLSIDNQGSIIQFSHHRFSAMGAKETADLKKFKKLFRQSAKKKLCLHHLFFRFDD